jgi:hypothetical protein
MRAPAEFSHSMMHSLAAASGELGISRKAVRSAAAAGVLSPRRLFRP